MTVMILGRSMAVAKGPDGSSRAGVDGRLLHHRPQNGQFRTRNSPHGTLASNVPAEFREQALERSGFAKRLAKARMLLEKVTVQGGVVREVRPPT
ncbi:hypothetical protein [Pseudarthrobacter albicanus]|uniref:hypothetical protein n=1 Tax=Pseudarthrobacter albicanus TaxID=2823873 RepID=UPI001BAE1CFD|nr:hypothetical protein [Pseudarthrobacter albicanus]